MIHAVQRSGSFLKTDGLPYIDEVRFVCIDDPTQAAYYHALDEHMACTER